MKKLIHNVISSLRLAAAITIPGTIVLFAVMAPFLLFDDVHVTGLAITTGIIGYISFIAIAIATFLTEYID